MRNGLKSVSIAAVTAAVLTAAACSSSGQIGAAPGSTGSTGPAAPKTSSAGAASSTSSTGSAASDSSSSASTAASSSGTSTGGSGAALTSDQISKLLLTDKDAPGYTFDASQDSTGTTDTQDVVTTGGAACQAFSDAENGLSTKYGTLAEVDRQLTKSAVGHVIQDSVLTMPSADKAQAMIADLTASLQGCKSLTMPISGSPGSMTLGAIPQLMKSGQAGYIDYLTAGGKTVLMTAELLQVGPSVSMVALIGPVTSDNTALEQMGATMGHLSEVQAGRLKAAQGLS